MSTGQQWKPQGYQRLAHLQARYPGAAIYRRFGPLNALLLLSLQAKLVILEKELQLICKHDDCDGTAKEKIYSTNFEAMHSSIDPNDKQKKKFEEVRVAMSQYYDLLQQTAQVAQLPQPENHQLRFLDNWLSWQKDGKGFLTSKEAFTWSLQHKDDLINPIPSPTWLNPRLIDFFHWLRNLGSEKVPDPVRIPDVELGVIQDVEALFIMRTTRIVWSFLMVLFTALLPVLGILILYFVKHTLYRIAIAIGLTAFVGFFMGIFTSANNKEIFGATAAFAAIVVVFIGSANGV